MNNGGPKRDNGREAAGHLALEVMHEIKNSLDALGNLAYLTFEAADDPEQVRNYTRLAQEQVATFGDSSPLNE